MQWVPDVRRKLQKLEGFEVMNVSQLLEIVQNVYNNQDSEEDKQNKKLTRTVVPALRETDCRKLRSGGQKHQEKS